MSANKPIVEKYMEGFRRTDHEMILSCVTDDVEWESPGHFHHFGKDAFDKEIENDAFTGSPEIEVARLSEDGNFVFAEGTVRCQMKTGKRLTIRFCDVFELQDSKIKKLTSYLNILQ